MIELSITDVLFICWGGIATAIAGHFYTKERTHHMFVTTLINNPDMRKKFFDDMDEYKEEKQKEKEA